MWQHTSLDASPSSHCTMTGAFRQEVVLGDDYQQAWSVSTLNHNTLLLAGQQWWPATTHSLLAASSTPPSCSKSNKRLSLMPPPVFALHSFSQSPSVQLLSSASKLTGLGSPCIPPRCLPAFVPAILDQTFIAFRLPLPSSTRMIFFPSV